MGSSNFIYYYAWFTYMLSIAKKKKKDKQQATYLEFVRICSPFILPGWLHSVVKVAISASHSPGFPISYMISSKQDAKKAPLPAPIYISATRRHAVILIIHHLFFFFTPRCLGSSTLAPQTRTRCLACRRRASRAPSESCGVPDAASFARPGGPWLTSRTA